MCEIDNEIENIVMEIKSFIDNIENEDLEDCLDIEPKHSISIDDFQTIIDGIIMGLGDGAYLDTKDKDDYYIIYKGLKITIEYKSRFLMSKKCWYGTYEIYFYEI
jgi:hypothetical protein